jgi:hypothetical protein
MRYSERFAVCGKAAPFVADEHACEECAVGEVEELDEDLPHVGVHDVGDEAAGALS